MFIVGNFQIFIDFGGEAVKFESQGMTNWLFYITWILAHTTDYKFDT